MKKRPFTLLEVLVALLLITTALPLLIAPYFYEMLHSSNYRKALLREDQQFKLQAALFEAMHLKKLKPLDTNLEEWKQVDPSWLPAAFPKAFYQFTRVKPEKIKEPLPKVELWALTIRWEDEMKAQNPIYITVER